MPARQRYMSRRARRSPRPSPRRRRPRLGTLLRPRSSTTTGRRRLRTWGWSSSTAPAPRASWTPGETSRAPRRPTRRCRGRGTAPLGAGSGLRRSVLSSILSFFPSRRSRFDDETLEEKIKLFFSSSSLSLSFLSNFFPQISKKKKIGSRLRRRPRRGPFRGGHLRRPGPAGPRPHPHTGRPGSRRSRIEAPSLRRAVERALPKAADEGRRGGFGQGAHDAAPQGRRRGRRDGPGARPEGAQPVCRRQGLQRPDPRGARGALGARQRRKRRRRRRRRRSEGAKVRGAGSGASFLSFFFVEVEVEVRETKTLNDKNSSFSKTPSRRPWRPKWSRRAA